MCFKIFCFLTALFILPVNQTIAQSKLLPKISQEEKIFMLSDIWKEVSYNFDDPQKLKTIKWDSLYSCYIKDVLQTNSDYEFYNLLKKFIATLDDGHTELFLGNIIKSSAEYGSVPLMIQDIGSKFYLLAKINKELPGIPLGSELVMINNIPAHDYVVKYALPYATGSTFQYKIDQALLNLSDGKRGDSINLKFILPDKNISSTCLKYKPREELDMKDFSFFPSVWAKEIREITTDSLLYLRVNGFESRSFIKYLIENRNQVSKTKGIILDLRYNRGGNEEIADSLLMCFLAADSIKTYKSLTRKHNAFFSAMGYGYPSYKTYYNNQALDTLAGDTYRKKDLPTFTQPLVILIGTKTFSAAEDLLLALKINAPNRAVLIGTPTGGSTGAPLVRVFKSGIYYRICTRKPLVDPELFKNGIQPDIVYEKTIEEYMNDTDKIIDIAKKTINIKR